ncbi:succinylglutamate desuccinylase/aspartoacylase family protein [Pseudomarimonas arenosa]|uniref:Succinylglutamate desuccinylase/aspartoacylase family protein n=1 Tax=Pseudomarimonas arenosa TaxID=2774145 RepID=A0AAW3ZGU0_9GAMM|nr:succinylglutamate desuccinylase/aspartoacylase family protein [Pseudomarimonas arenosa]MBD8525241.1 succinylglutamate desuccinylase/aspartoacylase family protein [Pseudomarimonas arenosa]
MRAAFEIGGQKIKAGERATVELPLSVLSNHQPVTLPVHVVHGRKDGPVFFLSAAIHGDEITGVEVIRQVLRFRGLRPMHGTLLAVPVVNAFGFIARSRYLPDRRDLNRCFPGSPHGSLANQLAHLFMTEVVSRCQYGIDLHSAAIHRANLPQIRADLGDPRIHDLASAFSAPIMIDATLRDGSLRQSAREAGVVVLLYEAGEALRFDDLSVRVGVRGVLSVLRHLGMIRAAGQRREPVAPMHSNTTYWVRAASGGVFRRERSLGAMVAENEVLGVISDPFGEAEQAVHCRKAGLIIGLNNLPVVNQGDALFHIARLGEGSGEVDVMIQMEQQLYGDALSDSEWDTPMP